MNLLATSPLIGYECAEIGASVRRHDHHQHAVFYRIQDQNIFIFLIYRIRD
nr:hypothetical protein [Acinetobacter guillouiae]